MSFKQYGVENVATAVSTVALLVATIPEEELRNTIRILGDYRRRELTVP